MLRRLTEEERIDGALRLSVESWACTVSAWGSAPGQATEVCGRLIEESRAKGRALAELIATLGLAEAKWRAGSRREAAELAAAVKLRARDWGPSSEWLWRAEAIASLSAPAEGLTPFPIVSRLSLGEDLAGWSGRTDVVRLARRVLR